VNLIDNRSESSAPLEVSLRKESDDYVAEVFGAVGLTVYTIFRRYWELTPEDDKRPHFLDFGLAKGRHAQTSTVSPRPGHRARIPYSASMRCASARRARSSPCARISCGREDAMLANQRTRSSWPA